MKKYFSMEEQSLDIDTSWMDEFEKYNDFYKEKITEIKVNYLFLNRAGYIDKVRSENILLETSNLLSKEQLILMLKQILIKNKKQYSLLSMFIFNISLNNKEVEEVYKNNSIDFNDYITTINGIDDIYWKDSINLFKDMNELNIIFMKKQTNKNTTKRVYFGKKSNAKHTRRKYN